MVNLPFKLFTMYIAFYSENVDVVVVVVVSLLAAWGGRDRCANKEWLTSWTNFFPPETKMDLRKNFSQ